MNISKIISTLIDDDLMEADFEKARSTCDIIDRQDEAQVRNERSCLNRLVRPRWLKWLLDFWFPRNHPEFKWYDPTVALMYFIAFILAFFNIACIILIALG